MTNTLPMEKKLYIVEQYCKYNKRVTELANINNLSEGYVYSLCRKYRHMFEQG